MVQPSLEFFALTFALFKAGAVPVLIDPGMGVKNLGRCLAEAEPEAFIGIPKAQVARRLLGWGRATIRDDRDRRPRRLGVRPARLDARFAGRRDRRPRRRPRSPDSAPTRPPRSSSPAAAPAPPRGRSTPTRSSTPRSTMLRDLYGIEPGEVDLCTFPLFALFAPALGMTCDRPRDGRDPAGAGRPREDPRGDRGLRRDEPVRLARPAPPGRRVRRGARRQAAVAPPGDLGRGPGAGAGARDVRDAARARASRSSPPTGPPRRCPVCSIGSDEILGETRHATDRGAGVCVGRPVAGMRVEIIADQRRADRRRGPTTCSCPTARSARSSSRGRS